MKKIFNIVLLSAVTVALMVSCSKDFLDNQGTEFLTSAELEEAVELDAETGGGLMLGAYSLTFQTGTGGTTGHDDFGQKGYDIFGDMLSGDMALSQSTYGWYRASITEFQGPQDYTFQDNYQVWRHYYRIIRFCNQIIDGLGGTDFEPESEGNKHIMGQAKALRAHSYFYLTQFFQKEYDASELILPIYKSSEDQNGPKASAEEVYNFMTKDLDDATRLLDGFVRSSKTEINKTVAHGIYAYVLGAKGDYSAAYTQAKSALDAGEHTLMGMAEVSGLYEDYSLSGFNDVNTPGWMWGVDLNTEIGLGLVSWWGQMDYFSYSYAAYGDNKAMDQLLFDAIPDNDVRKTQFYNNPSSSYHLMPLYKFYDENRVWQGASSTVQADYVYMRIAEMHLLAAEYAARSGQEGVAKNHLKQLLQVRLLDFSYVDGLAGTDLTDEIYLQTRIELWGEGKSYLAMKRNKATTVRGENHLSFVGVPIPYNDERMTFEIPESEIQNNPFISTQNN